VIVIQSDFEDVIELQVGHVVELKVIARHGSDDRSSMLFMNKAFFVKTALDADYEASNVRPDDHRVYAISRTTRVQEVEDHGQPGANIGSQKVKAAATYGICTASLASNSATMEFTLR
jgi:hypothetical protein